MCSLQLHYGDDGHVSLLVNGNIYGIYVIWPFVHQQKFAILEKNGFFTQNFKTNRPSVNCIFEVLLNNEI